MDQVRIVIEAVTPQVDGGRFPVKAVVGDRVEVGADIWKDGHEVLRAAVLYRKLAPEEMTSGEPARRPDRAKAWREAPMASAWEANDRWTASFVVDEVGPWAFAVEAWTDFFGSWRADLRKRAAARQVQRSDLLEGMELIAHVRKRATGDDRVFLDRHLAEMRAAADDEACTALALDERLFESMTRSDPRSDARLFPVEVPLWVDREKARCGAWYEIFPRSQGTVPGRSCTLREAEARLPAIAAMGFDVLYLTPIHPIGRSHRKGRNNSETCLPDDCGSPWAIGSDEGGHCAVHPELGTLEDFDHFLAAAAANGLEIALDFALQCSPDHPWVTEHPAWFAHRPDGTIKYAENPPKKYQDIYPINFETEDRLGLYLAVLDVVLFWAARGVKIFRVDNPHTKAISFWEWLIAEVHRRHPDALFLAEAFTRPKRMRMLAKAGFTQSYTYFTWRTLRPEIEAYAEELFLSDVASYFRPNFFVNTPDILHEILQQGGRPAFIHRLVLGATLSPTYGIYSGYELCENRAVRPGSEEYADSEKYEIKVWDWDRPGNIIAHVERVNRIRRDHPALRRATNLTVLESTDPHIIAYAKTAGGDRVVVVINLDPHAAHEGMVNLPPAVHGHAGGFEVVDLLTDARYPWRDGWNFVRLDPWEMPAHILHVPD